MSVISILLWLTFCQPWSAIIECFLCKTKFEHLILKLWPDACSHIGGILRKWDFLVLSSVIQLISLV